MIADLTGAENAARRRAALSYHGGDLAAARALFPDAAQPWIDLSTGICPFAYPAPAIEPDVWRHLPDRSELAALEASAARAFGLADPHCLVAAPGTQAIIQRLPEIAPARQAAGLGFSYSEYERIWTRAGASFARIDDLREADGFDVVVVVNPNNPDGRLLGVANLARCAQTLAARGGALVVDEAFIDYAPREASLAPWALECGAIVLRSFGKAYGLPGARLGFALARAPIALRLREQLGPWAVSGPAIAIGRAAYADPRWLAATRAALTTRAARLDALLSRAGFEIIGGTNLFRLARRKDAQEAFERLAARGVLARPFLERPTWLRFGLPRDDEWAQLDERLATI